MNQTSLATIEPGINYDLQINRDPEEVVKEAARAAAVLKSVIDRKEKPVIFNGQQYIEFEDWQTVGKFYGLVARVDSTDQVTFGDSTGFIARATVIHAATGNVISSAEAMCLNDEENWGERKGKKVPLFQLRSMAQTRACAKAFRNCLAWVVVLAGYKATPAEEMTGEEVSNTVGQVEEFDFAIKKAETEGQYGKPVAYWERCLDLIHAGKAVEFEKETRNGKKYKAWRFKAADLDLDQPIDKKTDQPPGEAISPAQKEYIRKLRKTRPNANIAGYVFGEFGAERLEDLTKQQASKLINWLNSEPEGGEDRATTGNLMSEEEPF